MPAKRPSWLNDMPRSRCSDGSSGENPRFDICSASIAARVARKGPSQCRGLADEASTVITRFPSGGDPR